MIELSERIVLPVPESVSPEVEQRIVALRNRFASLDDVSRNQRARDVAALLGCTEAQWVASQCRGVRAVPLVGPPADVFARLGTLGEVMALTRNDSCVHERHGKYRNVRADGPVGLVHGPDIDLRLFFDAWGHCWAVQENGLCSLQFFDTAGTAIHKVYCTEKTDIAVFVALVREFAAAEQVWPVSMSWQPDPAADRIADARALRAGWLALRDPHDFFPLLRRLAVTRLAAVQAVGADLAQRVAASSVETMLHAVAQSALPIMCFVGNRGAIQIHTGAVRRIHRTGRWLNILDPAFSLHLDTTTLASTWVVNKPSPDGWITSLEAYSASGELVVQFFGARKPGTPELRAWREFVLSLCNSPLAE